jgi:5-methylcytosine-specific restriction endonuclease McrA
MTRQFKERIKKALRKLTWSWKPYKITKDEAKVDKATFECLKCKKYCYVGKSVASYDKLKEKYPDKVVEMGTIYIDHINPVEGTDGIWVSWDTYIERLFCEKSNLQPLCGNCHKIKTDIENSLRRENVSIIKNARRGKKPV